MTARQRPTSAHTAHNTKRHTSRRAKRLTLGGAAFAAVTLWGCGSAANAAYGPTRLMVAGEEVESLPEAPGEAAQLGAMLDDLADLERQLDLAPLSEDERPVALFTLGSRLAGLSAAYARRPAHLPTQLALARAYWLMGRCGRVGAYHLALALFDDAAANPDADAASRAAAHLYRARVALSLQQAGLAEAALAAGLEAADNAGSAPPPDLPLLRAKLLMAQRKPDAAQALLTDHLRAHPDDIAAARQRDQWRALAAQGLEVSAAPAALASYALHPPQRWALTHETLGDALDLPLDWLIADEQIQPDTSGTLQLVGPPYVGADRQWRHRAATLWVVPLQAGEDAAALASAYAASFPLDVTAQRAEATATRAALALATTQGGAPWRGHALLLSDGQMGYVLELWAEADRFAEALTETAPLWRSLRPLAADTPSATTAQR